MGSLTRAIWPSDGMEKLMRVCEKSWEVLQWEYQGSQAGDRSGRADVAGEV